MSKFSVLLAGLALNLFFCVSASADWQGTMSISSSAREGKTTQGHIFGKPGISRADLSMGQHETSSIVDYRSGKVIVLMHAQKALMETKLDPAQHGISCTSSDLLGCFKNLGYHKTGSESVNGHSCDTYEADLTPKATGKKIHQKIWYPTDLKEVPFLRTVSTHDDGKTTSVNITDVKVGPVAASQFEAPSDYKKMAAPDLSGLAEAMKARHGAPHGGMTPDAAEAMKKALMH